MESWCLSIKTHYINLTFSSAEGLFCIGHVSSLSKPKKKKTENISLV
jgi:hypothetical protein